MLLESLCRFYRDAVSSGQIQKEGWVDKTFRVAVMIDKDGELIDILDISNKEKRITINVPVKPDKRNTRIIPALCYDDASYAIGYPPKPDNKKYQSFREKQHELLDGIEDEYVEAFLTFLDGWEPEMIKDHILEKDPDKKDYTEKEKDKIRMKSILDKNPDILFLIGSGQNLFSIEEVAARIMEENKRLEDHSGENAVRMQCLVTGEENAEIAVTHRKAFGKQSLVSINKEVKSYSSYDKLQGCNAPVSRRAEYEYTNAIQVLTSNSMKGIHNTHVGKTYFLFWTGDTLNDKSSAFNIVFNGTVSTGEKEATDAFESFSEGNPFHDVEPGTDCYFLVMDTSVNGRLVPKDFQIGTFGKIGANVNLHNERMRIANLNKPVPIFMLVNDIMPEPKKSGKHYEKMMKEMAEAVFFNRKYPTYLLSCAISFLMMDKKPGYGGYSSNFEKESEGCIYYLKIRNCTAFLKAYYTQNHHKDCPEEVLTVNVNEECNFPPYILGRIFAEVEYNQRKVHIKIYGKDGWAKKPTVKSKFFTLALTNPANAFVQIMTSNNYYNEKRKKLENKDNTRFIAELVEKIVENSEITETSPFPNRPFTQGEKAAFMLGYYHEWDKINHLSKKDSEVSENSNEGNEEDGGSEE